MNALQKANKLEDLFEGLVDKGQLAIVKDIIGGHMGFVGRVLVCGSALDIFKSQAERIRNPMQI